MKKQLIISEANEIGEENKNADEMIQMKERIAKLEALLNKTVINNKKILQAAEEEPEEILIRADDRIRVMSLCSEYLTLTTESKGRGKQYNFAKFGEIHIILYADLLDIIRNHRNFVEDGKFYIMSQKCIKVNGLQDIYDKLLTKEKILEIINGVNNDISIELFKSSSDKQQDSIVNMLIDKVVNGESIDLNFMDRISRIHDKDKGEFTIQNRIENMKKNLEKKEIR